ncbi:MAG: Bug family tripartite tricarboxylate transporter substrate binding protein [Lautropia sp.]
MDRRQFSFGLSSSIAALCTAGAMPGARAQAAYPAQTVKVIVALPVGGSVDMVARVLSQSLASALGQPFVVDNRAGGSGQIGVPMVSRAAPDGYTLMVSPASFLTTNKSIFKSLPYDPEADFAPITRLVNQPIVMVVKDLQAYPSVAAVIEKAKASPGKLTYASSGDGSPQHLSGLLFQSRTGTSLLHVPYKGGAPAINDMLGGQVDMLFAPLPEALPHVKGGKLHALGLMSDQRSPMLASTPTMRELGISDLTLSAWIGLLAPASTPRPIVDKLNQSAHAILNGAVRAKLGDNGMEVAPGTPEELRAAISREIKLHAELVRAAGLVPQ